MARAEVKARLSLESTSFDRGAARAMAAMNRLRGVAVTASAAVVAISAAAVTLATGIGYGTKRVFDLGSKLDDLTAQTGVAASELQKLQAVFKASGMGEDEVGMVINRMQKFIAANKQLKGLSPEKQFLAIVRAIQAIADPSERAQKAMEIFGRSGGRILAVQAKDFEDAAGFLGRSSSIMQQNVKDFDRASDLIGRAPDKLQQFGIGFASQITGSILPILERIDKIDFASKGEQLGRLAKATIEIVAGAFDQGKLGEIAKLTFEFAFLSARDTFVVGMKAGILNVAEFLSKQLDAAMPEWLKKLSTGTARSAGLVANLFGKGPSGFAGQKAAQAGGFVSTGPGNNEAAAKMSEIIRLMMEMRRHGEQLLQKADDAWGMKSGGYDIPSALSLKAGGGAEMPVSALRKVGGGMFGGNFGAGVIRTVQDNQLSELKKIERHLERMAGRRNFIALGDNF